MLRGVRELGFICRRTSNPRNLFIRLSGVQLQQQFIRDLMRRVSLPFQVFDYRKDIANMLVTPQIRSRFLKMEVGQFNQSHTHDLGQEIFLVLQGQAEFDIEGHKEVLGPGQMCIALTDEAHTVRNVGDDEVIMYLSVTPHILPTHTYWTAEGREGAAAICEVFFL